MGVRECPPHSVAVKLESLAHAKALGMPRTCTFTPRLTEGVRSGAGRAAKDPPGSYRKELDLSLETEEPKDEAGSGSKSVCSGVIEGLTHAGGQQEARVRGPQPGGRAR